MFQHLIDRFLPEWQTIRTVLLPILIISISAALLAGKMKQKGIRTPYTRKTFHFVIFSLAGILQYFYGLKAVSLMAGIFFIMVIIA